MASFGARTSHFAVVSHRWIVRVGQGRRLGLLISHTIESLPIGASAAPLTLLDPDDTFCSLREAFRAEMRQTSPRMV